MNMPFYVAPEQVMKDRADYARKGIARGRSLVGFRFDKGVAICAENTSSTLRKVSEIYDRIAFAGVGKYNEFDQLRIAGVRHADMKGYSFSREDVDARSLANQYAQSLGPGCRSIAWGKRRQKEIREALDVQTWLNRVV